MVKTLKDLDVMYPVINDNIIMLHEHIHLSVSFIVYPLHLIIRIVILSAAEQGQLG